MSRDSMIFWVDVSRNGEHVLGHKLLCLETTKLVTKNRPSCLKSRYISLLSRDMQYSIGFMGLLTCTYCLGTYRYIFFMLILIVVTHECLMCCIAHVLMCFKFMIDWLSHFNDQWTLGVQTKPPYQVWGVTRWLSKYSLFPNFKHSPTYLVKEDMPTL